MVTSNLSLYAVWEEITYQPVLFAFHEDEGKLAIIDIVTGSLSYIGNNISYDFNTRDASVNTQTNEYIGFEMDYTNGPFLVKKT